MKYLNEGGTYGDTAFNSWPVPMVPVSNMPKTTQKVHDDIFENDPAEDSGIEDGSGSAAVQDLAPGHAATQTVCERRDEGLARYFGRAPFQGVALALAFDRTTTPVGPII